MNIDQCPKQDKTLEGVSHFLIRQLPLPHARSPVKKPVFSLAEVVRTVGEHQLQAHQLQEEGVKAKKGVVEFPKPKSQIDYSNQQYNPAMSGSVYGAINPSETDLSGAYSQGQAYIPSSKAPAPAGLVVSDKDVHDIIEDAKLKAMGLGGSGKHIDCRTQEAFDTLKRTSHHFAMNQVLYHLALT